MLMYACSITAQQYATTQVFDNVRPCLVHVGIQLEVPRTTELPVHMCVLLWIVVYDVVDTAVPSDQQIPSAFGRVSCLEPTQAVEQQQQHCCTCASKEGIVFFFVFPGFTCTEVFRLVRTRMS